MSEIGDQPVRHVAHRMRDSDETRPETGARLGRLKSRNQACALGRIELRILPPQHPQPEMGVADRAADPDPVAGPRTAAADLRAGSDVAERGQRQRRRPRRRDRIAAEQIDPEAALILGEPGREALDPIVAERRRQRRRQQVMQRPRAFRGEVRQIDPQQLFRDQLGRIVRQVMHALDHRIDGHDETAPGGAIDQRRVVGKSEPARSGERREEPPDAAELAEPSPSGAIGPPPAMRAPGGRRRRSPALARGR